MPAIAPFNSVTTEALSKPGFVGNNSLICLNGKPHRASVLHVRLGDHFPPSSTPTFSRARRRTGSTLRPGPAVLRSDFAHRFGPLYPALRMVRQRGSTVSTHLVGACVHRQARLSVYYHQRAHGRPEVPAFVATTLRLGKLRRDSQRTDFQPRLRRVCTRPVAPANSWTPGQNPRRAKARRACQP